MIYSMSDDLQAEIYSRLRSDPQLSALVDGAIYDMVPEDAPDLFVALGAEDSSVRSDSAGHVATHDIQISVVTRRDGYMSAKRVAGRVSDVLLDADRPFATIPLISFRFLRAKARRDEGEGTRRVDLWFRVRLDGEIKNLPNQEN